MTIHLAGEAAARKKTCIIYVRVSLDATGEGRSVARQEEACRALALARGWQVLRVEKDESISAYGKKHRPGWTRVLAAIENREADVVCAWHMDRMTRSMIELEKLILSAEKTGVGVATASGDIDLTTDTGRMVARILAAVARAEVERKGARQKLANAQRAAEGKPVTNGIRPFGYTRNGMSIVPEEAALIRDGAKRILRGESLASVARRWTEVGLLSPWGERGSGWSSVGVKGVLVAPRSAGQRAYLGTIVGPGQWPAILDEDTYLQLRMKLEDPARRNRRGGGGRVPETMLSGLARCGRCGGRIVAGHNRDVPVYRCGAGKGCVSVDRHEADMLVTGFVIERLSRPDAAETLTPSASPELGRARERVHALRARKKAMAEMFAAGEVDQEDYAASNARMRGDLAEAEAILAASGSASTLDGFLGVEDVVKVWDEAALEQRRTVVGALCDITVHRRTAEIRTANLTLKDKTPAPGWGGRRVGD